MTIRALEKVSVGQVRHPPPKAHRYSKTASRKNKAAQLINYIDLQNGLGAFILQCKRIDVHFCDHAGSSRGMK